MPSFEKEPSESAEKLEALTVTQLEEKLATLLEDVERDHATAQSDIYLRGAVHVLIPEAFEKSAKADIDDMRIRIWESLKDTDIVATWELIEHGLGNSAYGFLVTGRDELNPHLVVPLTESHPVKKGIPRKDVLRGVYSIDNREVILFEEENMFARVLLHTLDIKSDFSGPALLAHELTHDSNSSVMRSRVAGGGIGMLRLSLNEMRDSNFHMADYMRGHFKVITQMLSGKPFMDDAASLHIKALPHAAFIEDASQFETALNESPVGEFIAEVLSDLSTTEVGARTVTKPDAYYTSERVSGSDDYYQKARTLSLEDMHKLERIAQALDGAGMKATTIGLGYRAALKAELHDNEKDRNPELTGYLSVERVYEYMLDTLDSLGYTETDIPELQQKHVLTSQIRDAQIRVAVQKEVINLMETRYSKYALPVYSDRVKQDGEMLHIARYAFHLAGSSDMSLVSVHCETKGEVQTVCLDTQKIEENATGQHYIAHEDITDPAYFDAVVDRVVKERELMDIKPDARVDTSEGNRALNEYLAAKLNLTIKDLES